MFAHTNKRGVTYYVHEARMKAGARRYVVGRTANGALADLPACMEIVENVNGQVSGRAARAAAILPLEDRLVQQALAQHDRQKYRIEVKGGDITVYEPDSNADELAEILDPRRPLDAWGRPWTR
jgi:hypothetical protein